jgi:transcription-repair coupling factor
MSSSPPPNWIQDSLRSFAEAVLTQPVTKLRLNSMQLPLAATVVGTRHPVAVVISGSKPTVAALHQAVTAWQSLLDPTVTWHMVNDTLSEQEKTGAVTTTLSQAMHSLLAGPSRQHRYLIHEAALATPPPSVAAYQDLALEWTVGDRLTTSLQQVSSLLTARGFVRYTGTPEPGGWRVRGENIDITHPLFPGHYTLTWYGSVLERITHRVGQRSQSSSRLHLPPLLFPPTPGSWNEILSPYLIFHPHAFTHLTSSMRVMYDAVTPDIPFGWQPISEVAPAFNNRQALVLYTNLDHVQDYLKHRRISDVETYESPLGQIPIALATEDRLVVSEAALFPAPPETKTSSRHQALDMLAQLVVGRPAVHSDHGIGIYEGLHHRQLGGAAREYLVLRYAEGDTLSVPVEYAHKVTPYVGEKSPAVHRLGGTLWHKTRRAATQDAYRLAQQLVAIARERHQAERSPYLVATEIETQLARDFPYELTPDQRAAWEDIKNDLAAPEPMDRLVVGDVGFGKTELAQRAAAHVVANGGQVAVIAPTTLLAQQHTDTFKQRLPQLASQIGTLSRFISRRQHIETKQKIASGEVAIAIGTHALLSKTINWKHLRLVIIDEEQRFGVRHKEHFKKLRASVDILSLSATPIPRTLSMAMTGLRDLSIISTAPQGRRSIKTVVGPYDEPTLQRALVFELDRDGQTYVVAPKVSQLGALRHTISQLVPAARVAVAHGQMPEAQLAQVMEQFDTGHIDILVSSSIVENGLDLPNANTLCVMSCTHFGLSDLYQLRGRVGRRERQGYAYFFYNQAELTSVQRARLAALTEASRLGSGWDIARHDLEIRGAGNLLGAEQSGSMAQVGLQLYMDLVEQAIDSTSAARPEVDVELPLTALLPPHYVANLEQRTRWYTRLSRARTLTALETEWQRLEQSYGTAPREAHNLKLLLSLQLVAGSVGINRITHKTISPPGDTPYERLTIHTDDVPATLKALNTLGTWAVRHHTLSHNLNAITPDFLTKLLAALE